MKNTNWGKVREIFDTAVELDGNRRWEFLKSVEINDGELYNEVISLLSADQLEDLLPETRGGLDLIGETSPFEALETNPAVSVPGRSASLIGEVIGNRYRIEKKLGSGGMGDVFLARDRNVMDRETVVKMLKSETNPEFVRKFRHEIEALARLKDAGIVTILDSGSHGDQQFIVLEYVEGEDLSLIISPVLFSVRDFVAPERLAAGLVRGDSNKSLYFWGKLSSHARSQMIGAAAESETPRLLRDEFNRLLTDPKLYDPNVFTPAEVAPPVRIEDLRENTDALMKFNRTLIEAAFPGEIVRGRDKILTKEEAARIFRQLGSSLTHGHEKGIIHRDLKPSNIMMTRSGDGGWQTKLIDFGVAKVRESLVAPTTQAGLSFGTRKYMSPEQVNGRSNLTAAADIYALGLVAFEALTGQDIFPTESFIERCRLQEKEEFSDITRLRRDLSPKVREVIGRALAFEPENRPATAAEFGNALADALLEADAAPARTEMSVPVAEHIPADAAGFVETPVAEEIPVPPQIAERPEKRRGLTVFTGILAMVLILLAGGGALFGLWWYLNSGEDKAGTDNKNAAAPAKTFERELQYKLIVQKFYDGKPFQEPFEATGDEIFGDGWQFRLVMESPQGGHLYLLAESQQDQGLIMLFPHPQQNEGASKVPAGEKIETARMQFDKNQGTEKFWIVWAEDAVPELEAVKSYVNPDDLGRIKDAEKEKAVRDLLGKTTDTEVLKEEISKDKTSKTVRSTGKILVKRAEFRHN